MCGKRVKRPNSLYPGFVKMRRFRSFSTGEKGFMVEFDKNRLYLGNSLYPGSVRIGCFERFIDRIRLKDWCYNIINHKHVF